MTAEEKVRFVIGDLMIANISLQNQLDEAKVKIAELEKAAAQPAPAA